MKNILFLMLSLFWSAFLGVAQTLDWSTYIPIKNNYPIGVTKGGNVFIGFWAAGPTNNPNFNFSSWLTPNAYSSVPLPYDHFLLVTNSKQDIVYGSYMGPQMGPVIFDNYGSFYMFGETQSTTGIATTGAHQDSFNDNSVTKTVTLPGGIVHTYEEVLNDGFIVKFNGEYQKVWGTYFNGDDGATSVSAAKWYNNALYVSGSTSSTSGFATSGAPLTTPMPNAEGYDTFLAKFDGNGQLLWCTYTHGKHKGSLELTMDSAGNIYSYASYITGYDTIHKFNNQGMWVDSFTRPDDTDHYFISPDDKFYFTGVTSQSTGIATPNTYKPVKTFDKEYFVVCYDSNFNKLWGTYIDAAYDDPPNLVRYFNHLTDFDVNGHFTMGIPSSTPNLANVHTIKGKTDFYLISLNKSGQRHWGAYYGGTDTETLLGTIRYDAENNLYINGRTYSTSGIATPGALVGTAPNLPGYLPAFVAKFKNIPLSTEVFSENTFRIYPNPVSEILHIENEVLFNSNDYFEIYDLSGKKVMRQQAYGGNVNSIKIKHLSEGVYFLKINSAGKAETLKFLVKK